eukprot:gnl/TRDRNA2_/TRDRNA2_41743_c0_seq1.p1 gnl/TRDRNA2_/TRDRNA2_41743_c0~~gnl/TRDRNA2_/TRDRNA2_41743_c0_seq1.p1  ORF type:complete len:485 (-),score=89.94 gnl/TRDRNA2_/TRDRNA2_41743_c0_seq1:40-1458(-)
MFDVAGFSWGDRSGEYGGLEYENGGGGWQVEVKNLWKALAEEKECRESACTSLDKLLQVVAIDATQVKKIWQLLGEESAARKSACGQLDIGLQQVEQRLQSLGNSDQHLLPEGPETLHRIATSLQKLPTRIDVLEQGHQEAIEQMERFERWMSSTESRLVAVKDLVNSSSRLKTVEDHVSSRFVAIERRIERLDSNGVANQIQVLLPSLQDSLQGIGAMQEDCAARLEIVEAKVESVSKTQQEHRINPHGLRDHGLRDAIDNLSALQGQVATQLDVMESRLSNVEMTVAKVHPLEVRLESRLQALAALQGEVGAQLDGVKAVIYAKPLARDQSCAEVSGVAEMSETIALAEPLHRCHTTTKMITMPPVVVASSTRSVTPLPATPRTCYRLQEPQRCAVVRTVSPPPRSSSLQALDAMADLVGGGRLSTPCLDAAGGSRSVTPRSQRPSQARKTPVTILPFAAPHRAGTEPSA